MSKQYKSSGTGIAFDAGDLRKNLQKMANLLKNDVAIAGAAAGARVVGEAIQAAVPRKSGLLAQSMYRYYDDKESVPGRQIYYVGVNKRLAKHWYNVEYGHFRYNRIINGHAQRSKSKPSRKIKTPGVMDHTVHDLSGALDTPVWVPATPYLRPAYENSIRRALQAVIVRMGKKYKELT